MKKYITPLIMLVVFETVAVTLWLTKDSLHGLCQKLSEECTIIT